METPAANSTAPSPRHFAFETLEASRPGIVMETKIALGETTLTIARENIREACRILRDAGFNSLSDLTCMDLLPDEPRFRVVYHLLSMRRKERVRLKVPVPGEAPSVDSVIPVWPTANFYEREIFDLFGVRFAEHPNMRRIMMPEDWEGYPLRKDYPVEGYR